MRAAQDDNLPEKPSLPLTIGDFDLSRPSPPPDTPGRTVQPSAPAPEPAGFGGPGVVRIGVALTLLFGYLLARNLFFREPQAQQDNVDRVQKTVQALRSTKVAVTLRPPSFPLAPAPTQAPIPVPSRPSFPTAPPQTGKTALPGTPPAPAQTTNRKTTPPGSPGSDVSRSQDDAIQQWRELAEAKHARASDWRRYGLTLMLFGKTVEGKKALAHIGSLPLEPEKQQRTDPNAARHPFPPEQEKMFWERVFGPEPIDAPLAQQLHEDLPRLNLGWFENVAAAHLYARAGQTATAAEAAARVRSSAEWVLFLSGGQMLLLLMGVAVLLTIGMLRLLKSGSGTASSTPPSALARLLTPQPQRRPALTPFSADVRLKAFVLYFAVPILASLPLAALRAPLQDASLLVKGRISVLLYVLMTALAMGVALQFLRRQAQREENSRPLGFAGILHALGFRTEAPGRDAMAGLIGYSTTLPLLIIAGLISSFLFSRFPTPPHPVLIQLATMTHPFDQALMLLETGVIAAITEEMMFRGVLYPALRARWGVLGGITATSALFALAHPTLPGGFLSLWTLGATFALAYEWRGSLLPGILMHALNNSLLLLTQFAILAK